MTIHFYIVRHAIKEKTIGDVPITPIGIEQAKLTAQFFNDLPVTEVISSPLRRVKETAAYIARNTKITVRVDTRLRERANWGDLPDQTFDEFIEMWEKCTREPDYIPPIGDSVRQACGRMTLLLRELVEEHPNDSHIVIVTHGGLITDFLVNTFPEKVLNEFHPNFIAQQSELVSECSITKLTYDGGHYRLDSFASIAHLNAGS